MAIGSILLLELVGILALMVLGFVLGTKISGLKKWWIAIIPSLCFLFCLILFRFEYLSFFRGRSEQVMAAVLLPALLIPLVLRLSHQRQQRLGLVATFLIVMSYSGLPFIGPVFDMKEQHQVDTFLTEEGVALQSTSYNCGPAASATILYKKGIEADEGDLAIACRTSRFTGTPVDMLLNGVSELYGIEGLHVMGKPLDGLKSHCPFIAVVKLSAMFDHYIVVSEISDEEVLTGDPLRGSVILSRIEFERRWRNQAIIFP